MAKISFVAEVTFNKITSNIQRVEYRVMVKTGRHLIFKPIFKEMNKMKSIVETTETFEKLPCNQYY